MAHIYDDEIWSKLSVEGKVKWLIIDSDNDAQRCTSCMYYACKCGGDVENV